MTPHDQHTSAEGLKPCPFCGSPAAEANNPISTRFVCTNMSCPASLTKAHQNRAVALDRWNRRAAERQGEGLEAALEKAQKEVARLKAALRQRTADIAAAQPDPKMPRLSPLAIQRLTATSEAWEAMAGTRAERIEATALEMLVAWQSSARHPTPNSADGAENKP